MTITRPDSQTLTFAYDTAGRLGTLTTPDGAYGYSYSGVTGNLTGITAPGLVLLAEGATHWSALRGMLEPSRAVGPLVHDARVAALCRQHGVRELWTADRDFGRFPDLRPGTR